MGIMPYAARRSEILSRGTTNCATGCTNSQSKACRTLKWRNSASWDTDSTKRRPGDVSIPLWRYGRGMAIDVAVICPLAASHVDSAEPCEEYARLHKHNRYDASFVNSRGDFVAMVFETSGAVNEEGENIMKQLIRFAAKRLGVGNSIFAGRAWARVSCSIQAAVAQAILNREHVGENEEEA